MATGENSESSAMQKYGIPFYSAAWVPYKELKSRIQAKDRAQSDEGNEDSTKESDAAATPDKDASAYYVVLAGGGGEGRSGIANAVIVAHFDFSSGSLSPEPVAKLVLGSELPYRMALHPKGDGLICALQNSCRFFKWDETEENGTHKLGVKESEKSLDQLQDVGQQLALVYDTDCSTLAVGGEEGNLRIFKWPSMELILNEAQAHSSVKDLCFSPDGKFLVSLGSRGPGRVWDVPSAKVVATLPNGNDEMFSCCRFVQTRDNSLILYIAAITECTSHRQRWKYSDMEHKLLEEITL
ncbi:SEC12-like protein 2 [Linum perenne]